MSTKWAVWSEGQQKPNADDITHGLGTDDDAVSSLAVRRGIVLLADCTNCGRQWKGVEPWGQIALYFMRQMPRVPEGTSPPWLYTRQGVLTMLHCNGCGKQFKMITDWDDVRKWVDIGIRSGYLDPRIMQAVRRT